MVSCTPEVAGVPDLSLLSDYVSATWVKKTKTKKQNKSKQANKNKYTQKTNKKKTKKRPRKLIS